VTVRTIHFIPHNLPRSPRFLDLSEQERAEELFSASNSAAKALMLWVMKRGKNYTEGELDAKMQSFLRKKLPLELKGNLKAYCRYSLEPTGLVAEFQDFKKPQTSKAPVKRKVNKYEITDDGQTYAKPAIARFLLLADELGISLNNLNGATKRNGRTSNAYVIAKILEALTEQGPHKPYTIGEKLKLVQKNVVLQNIRKLASLGLVSYDGTGIDTFKPREAELADSDKLERYLENSEELKSAVLSIYPRFTNFGRLRTIMELRLREIGREILPNKFAAQNKKLSKSGASEATSVLCRIGVYRFKCSGTSSKPKAEVTEVKITEKGELAFQSAYRPALTVARYPRSVYVNDGYQSILARIEADVRDLFRREFVRFFRTNGRLNRRDPDEDSRAIIDVVKERGLEEFRVRELAALLRIPRAALNRSVHDLRETGLIERGRGFGYWKLAREDPGAAHDKDAAEHTGAVSSSLSL